MYVRHTARTIRKNVPAHAMFAGRNEFQNSDYEEYDDGSSEKRTKYHNVQWTVCGTIEETKGKGRVDNRRCSHRLQLHNSHNLQVGKRADISGDQNAPRVGNPLQSQIPPHDTSGKIIELFSQSAIDLFIQPLIITSVEHNAALLKLITTYPRRRFVRQLSARRRGFF